MSVILILSALAWMFAGVMLICILRVSGACSAAEQRRQDKERYEKRLQGTGGMS